MIAGPEEGIAGWRSPDLDGERPREEEASVRASELARLARRPRLHHRKNRWMKVGEGG